MDRWKQAQNITQWKSVAKKISDSSDYFHHSKHYQPASELGLMAPLNSDAG